MEHLPRLDPDGAPAAPVLRYLARLRQQGFRGECRPRWSERLLRSTDNSIYQLQPSALLLPRDAGDVQLALAELASAGDGLHLTPRGGGTGTNGQSLSEGIVLDLSRHMNRILAVDAEARTATVQPGVIRDQINDAAAGHGLFFPPTVAPANRATLGGMIATDACGKGSRRYGRTSDHLASLKVVLADGTLVDTAHPPDDPRLPRLARLLEDARELIQARFPELHRGLTGYNLKAALDPRGGLHLPALFAGAEGTLGVVVEATVRLTPTPRHRRLALAEYADFPTALGAARELLHYGPSAIETADDMLLDLARQDPVWHRVQHLFSHPRDTRAINLLEFEGDDSQEIHRQVGELLESAGSSLGRPGQPTALTAVDDPADQAALWSMRARGAGLLGRLPGDRKPVAFMEDTVVPPEVLPEYVAELRGLLDGEGLRYAMYGHVDVGCLHVRPALDLRDPADAARLRRLSDAVCERVLAYGGLFWGEHGRGFRGEYAPRFMGPELYALMCRVKAVFDPDERLNPGKLARVDPELALVALDSPPTRGERDRAIPPALTRWLPWALACNGNGACFDYRMDEVMCPSYRVTGERRHSPKGRAMLVREWLARASAAGYGFPARPGLGWRSPQRDPEDLSHQVAEALAGCLGCKACATQCPVRVDVPELRSRFLEHYHGRYRRPVRDAAYHLLESLLCAGARGRLPAGLLLGSAPARHAAARLGLVELPRPAPGFAALERRFGLAPGEHPAAGTTVLVPDPYTAAYEPELWAAALALLQRLGLQPRLAPLRPPGKARHNRGLRAGFARQRDRLSNLLAPWADQGLALVSLEPSQRHLLADDYAADGGCGLPVESVAGWLARRLESRPARLDQRWRLLAHCTERTQDPRFQVHWEQALAGFGVTLEVPRLGCCGMAGAYGHEAEHADHSRQLFAAGWQAALEDREPVVVSGFSCRAQIRRLTGRRLPHPLQALQQSLETANPTA